MSIYFSALEKFVVENDIRSLGKLSVLFFVTRQLRDTSYPFSLEQLLTDSRAQLRGLSGPNVAKLLSESGFQIREDFLGEGGRTSRGSVKRAQLYVEWLNQRLVFEKNVESELRQIESFWVGKIRDIYYNSIIDLKFPTDESDYAGPRFTLRGDKVVISKGRVSYEKDDAEFVDRLIDQLRKLIVSICSNFERADNYYAFMRSVIDDYRSEIFKARIDLNIFALYSNGIQIEKQILLLSSQSTDDPPLDSERISLLESFLLLHGALVASTDEGKKLLSATSTYNMESVDFERFKRSSIMLTRAANSDGLIDSDTSEFICITAESSGSGKSRERTGFFGLVTSRNLWSWVFSNIIVDAFKMSEAGQYVLAGVGGFIDVAWRFVGNHVPEFQELVTSAPDLFRWLERVLDVIK